MQVRYEKLGRENARPVMEIFNDYIEHGTAAFADAPLPEASFSMLLEKTVGYPLTRWWTRRRGMSSGFAG